LNFDIIYGKAGSVLNEQYKLIGVRRYRTSSVWKFDTSKQTNDFWIQWRARFVLLPTQDTATKLAPIPTLLPSLPEDIFYPFALWSSAPRVLTSFGLLGTILFGVVLLVL